MCAQRSTQRTAWRTRRILLLPQVGVPGQHQAAARRQRAQQALHRPQAQRRALGERLQVAACSGPSGKWAGGWVGGAAAPAQGHCRQPRHEEHARPLLQPTCKVEAGGTAGCWRRRCWRCGLLAAGRAGAVVVAVGGQRQRDLAVGHRAHRLAAGGPEPPLHVHLRAGAGRVAGGRQGCSVSGCATLHSACPHAVCWLLICDPALCSVRACVRPQWLSVLAASW